MNKSFTKLSVNYSSVVNVLQTCQLQVVWENKTPIMQNYNSDGQYSVTVLSLSVLLIMHLPLCLLFLEQERILSYIFIEQEGSDSEPEVEENLWRTYCTLSNFLCC